MFSFLLTESPWELSCVCDIDRLRVVSNAWLHFSILTPGLPPPHYDRSVTQVTSSDTWHTLTFPAFIHWPFPDCNLKYCPIFAATHVSVLCPCSRDPHHKITIQSKILLSILPRNKKYILFRQVPGKKSQNLILKGFVTTKLKDILIWGVPKISTSSRNSHEKY